jgi:hypothetical protein
MPLPNSRDMTWPLRRRYSVVPLMLVFVLSACANAPQRASAGNVAGVYRGSLGALQIELVLTLDTDAKDSVHGWYVPANETATGANRVLLAGEFENDALSMEESHNDVDVSGTWSATLSDDGMSGTWSDAKGENEKPVTLKRIPGAPIPESP